MTEVRLPDAFGLPETFSYRQARDRGVSKRRLYGWRDDGVVEVVGRGLFRRAGAALADLDLIEVVHRAPEATLCLTSALVRHDLSDAIPAVHDVAVPRGRWAPMVAAPVRWHRFDPDTFEVGRETLRLDDETEIGLYGAARSVVDAFRLVSLQGSDVAHEALRRWLRAGGKPAELLAVAAHFPRVLPRLRAALEVLL
ncbi:MAG: type IV toxin-antitoxin system AbiEi family antitoxin domain-containing protein [Haloechinothrix sp.]